MTRIDAAVRRIAAAGEARREETEALRHRHALLRGEVERAVAEIDALIARDAAGTAG